MSTAFLVDNILNDKEEPSDSIISDTESDETSSLCGSPESNENISPSHHHYYHIQPKTVSSGLNSLNVGGSEIPTNKVNKFSETLLRTYNTMIRNSDCNTPDDHSDDASINFIEMCCSKCGHFQQLNKTRNNTSNNTSNSSNNVRITNVNFCSDTDNNTDMDIDFKCDKCENNEGVISNQKETTTTILKDNTKPILKFSVSAILGDKEECARVRHGKCVVAFNQNNFTGKLEYRTVNG